MRPSEGPLCPAAENRAGSIEGLASDVSTLCWGDILQAQSGHRRFLRPMHGSKDWVVVGLDSDVSACMSVWAGS